MKMKTFILNSITDTNLVLLFHYLIIFLLILGFYACSKTGARNTPPKPPSQESTNIKEAGSSASANTLLPDATNLKSENMESQTERS
jgi:hypothetical protein